MITKRFSSQMLEIIYFSLFYFFVIAIPAAFINFLLLGSPEEDKTYSMFQLIASLVVSLLSFALAPLVYGLIMKKRNGFLSHQQLKFKLVYSKTKEPVKPSHFILRSYIRVMLFPFISFPIIPYFLPIVMSKGKKTIYDYILGTEVQEIEK